MQKLPAGALAVAATALLLPVSQADTPAPGYAVRTHFDPGGFSVFATLSPDELVVFDGETIAIRDRFGGLNQLLATFDPPVFASFVEIAPGGGFAVVGESSDHMLYAVDLELGGLDPIVELMFNYDAAFEDADHLLVSAATFTTADNEIWRVDVPAETKTLVATAPGASGPVALNAAGDLFYGTTAFPLPPEGSTVLRWSAALLADPPAPLGPGDAVVLGTGFFGAASLAFDPAQNRLYLSESDFGLGINRVRLVEGDSAVSPVVVDADAFVTNLELVPGGGPAAFLPYQPEEGGSLWYRSTSIQEAVPERPAVFFSGPGIMGPGRFDVNVADGPPDGVAFTLVSAQGSLPPQELAIFLPNQGFHLFLGLDLATFDYDAFPFVLDGEGSGSKGYVNPGGLGGTLAVQMLLLDDASRLVGSSSVSLF